jgi:DNA-binding response OmpR family regulator
MMIPKVLVVEDSHLLRKILRDALTREGFTVYEAENGRSGLLAIREMHPDLVLLDILMPVMGGKEMFEELVANAGEKDLLPVIMLTSSEDKEVQDWITAHGLDTIKKDDTMIAHVLAKVKKLLR